MTPRAIVIHCSATKASQHVNADTIRGWHKHRGLPDIGFHYVIRRSGVVEPGCSEETPGAHVRGHNGYTLGICYAGGLDDAGEPADTRTPEQRVVMLELVEELCSEWSIPGQFVVGHRDFPGVTKACPCFDVQGWLRDGP